MSDDRLRVERELIERMIARNEEFSRLSDEEQTREAKEQFFAALTADLRQIAATWGDDPAHWRMVDRAGSVWVLEKCGAGLKWIFCSSDMPQIFAERAGVRCMANAITAVIANLESIPARPEVGLSRSVKERLDRSFKEARAGL